MHEIIEAACRLLEEGSKQPILHPHVPNDELQKVAVETDCPDILEGELCRCAIPPDLQLFGWGVWFAKRSGVSG